MRKEDDIEELAELEHDQWIAWSQNIAETENITPARLERWKLLWRPYAELTDAEKELDREWARKAYDIIIHRAYGFAVVDDRGAIQTLRSKMYGCRTPMIFHDRQVAEDFVGGREREIGWSVKEVAIVFKEASEK